MAFAVHLQHEGKPLSFLLDAVELAESHTGENLARAFKDMLDGFAITEKVSFGRIYMFTHHLPVPRQLLAITADNATNNDTMVDALADSIESFPGELNRGRCFDHIINLCAKSVLRAFEATKKDASAILDDAERTLQDLLDGIDLEGGLDLAASEGDGGDDDVDGWRDPLAAKTPEQRAEIGASIYPVQVALAKVTFIQYAANAPESTLR